MLFPISSNRALVVVLLASSVTSALSSKLGVQGRPVQTVSSIAPTHSCPRDEQRVSQLEPYLYEHLSGDGLRPLVLRQYARLYAEWKEAWRKERSRIDKSVSAMQETAL